MAVQWQSVPYQRGEVFADVPGIGRFLVRRRSKGERRWIVLLNGKPWGGVWSDASDAKTAVEEIVTKGAA